MWSRSIYDEKKKDSSQFTDCILIFNNADGSIFIFLKQLLHSCPVFTTDFKVHPDFTFWTKLSPPVPISKKWRLFQSRECEEMCVGGQSGSYNECVCMGTWGSLRFWGSISCSGSRCLTQSRKHSVFPVFLGWDTFSQSQAQGLIWIYQSCRLKIGHMHNLCCTNMVKSTLCVSSIGLFERL